MLRTSIIATTAVALAVVLAAPAIADPQQPVDYADILAVGANTTQYLADDLAVAYDNAGIGAPLDAWDAVNPATGATHDLIVVRPGVGMVRPAGGNDGLSFWEHGHSTGIEVVFVDRDQRADGTDNGLAFLPFAQDTLGYSASAPTPSFPQAPTSNAPATLTAAQLNLIYTCQATTWNDPRIGGASADTIHPVIPPSTSGTTTSFVAAIGPGGLGPCVTVAGDNDPNAVNTDADAIEPFSLARYSTVDNDFGIRLNSTGFRYTHILYGVMPVDVNTGYVPAKFQPLFGTGEGGISPTSNWICGPQAQAIVVADGFTALPAGTPCGVPLPYL